MQADSPAAVAGLVPHTDYILGADLMGPEDDLYSVVETNIGKNIHLFVYNSDSNRCREVGWTLWDILCTYAVTNIGYIQTRPKSVCSVHACTCRLFSIIIIIVYMVYTCNM